MRTANIETSIIFAAMLALGVAFAPGNAHGSEGDIASFENGNWTTNIRFDSVRITVTGPSDYFWQDTVESAAGLSLPGGRLEDGSYTYELRFSPPGIANRRMMETGSADENGRTVEQANRENTSARPVVATGTFRISNGSIVQGGHDEPEQSL